MQPENESRPQAAVDTSRSVSKPANNKRRRPAAINGVLVVVLVLLMAAVAAGGVAWKFGVFAPVEKAAALTESLTRADLVVTVTEDGTLESSKNLDIKCEVAGGSTILRIVQDGANVKEGDELVLLDSSLIEETINTQKIAYENAEAARIETEKTLEAATIAVDEYIKGTFLKDVQTAQANITIAMENLRTSQNSLAHTQRMARKGYVTSLQRDAQSFAVQRAELDLQIAETTKKVLEDFTKAKMLSDLTSKRDAAAAKARSSKAAVDLEKIKLRRLEQQLERCVIKAPQDGLVIYANDQSGGRGGQPTSLIEEGASVRERQSILRLPDLRNMQAKVLIHESKIDQVKEGMRARLRIQGHDYQGTVESVANQAEQTHWMSSGAKKFATIVGIDGNPESLLPGMTAAVTVLIANRPNVLSVPAQSLVENRGDFNCWVSVAGKPERRTVKLGEKSLERVEVLSGVNEGEQVLLDPRNHVAEAQEALKARREINVKQEFGETKAGGPNGAVAGRGPDGRGAGERGRGDRGPGLRGPGARGPGGPDMADRGSNGRGPGGANGPRGEGARRGFDIMQFDKDGDKKISADEAPAPMREFFETVDSNHDGFLDAKEIAVMRRLRPRDGAGPAPTSRGVSGGL